MDQINITREREIAFYLIKKLTSVAYLKETVRDLFLVTQEYEQFAAKTKDVLSDKRKKALMYLNESLDNAQTGLRLLNKDNHHVGYFNLWDAVDIVDLLQSREFDDRYHFTEIGFRLPPEPHVGLYKSIDAVLDRLASFGWAFGNSAIPIELAFLDKMRKVPSELEPLPNSIGKPIKYGSNVPESGIYLPIHDQGCPTYFAEGGEIKHAIIPVSIERTENGDIDFDLIEFDKLKLPWKLIWADDR